MLPFVKPNFSEDQCVVLQQIAGPYHTSNLTQRWLIEEKKFWPKDLWPPSSRDLNTLDHSIWAYGEAQVCKTSHPSVKTLNSVITHTEVDVGRLRSKSLRRRL